MERKNLILGGVIAMLVLGNVYFYGLANSLDKEKSEITSAYFKNSEGWDKCSKEYSGCAKDFNENEKIIQEITDTTVELLNKGIISIEEIKKHSSDVIEILRDNKVISYKDDKNDTSK